MRETHITEPMSDPLLCFVNMANEKKGVRLIRATQHFHL